MTYKGSPLQNTDGQELIIKGAFEVIKIADIPIRDVAQHVERLGNSLPHTPFVDWSRVYQSKAELDPADYGELIVKCTMVIGDLIDLLERLHSASAAGWDAQYIAVVRASMFQHKLLREWCVDRVKSAQRAMAYEQTPLPLIGGSDTPDKPEAPQTSQEKFRDALNELESLRAEMDLLEENQGELAQEWEQAYEHRDYDAMGKLDVWIREVIEKLDKLAVDIDRQARVLDELSEV